MRIRACENSELRRRHGQRATAPECIIEAHQPASDERIIGLVEGASALHLVDRPLLQMILQIAPDALSVEHRRDAERRKPFRRSEAGAVQHLYRSDRTGAQDYLAFGAGLDGFTALNETHTDGAPLLEDEAIDQHVFFEPQIGALQCWFQKASRR